MEEKKKELRKQLINHYESLLIKYYKYMNGDDRYAPNTEELKILRPLNIILEDLKIK